MTSEEKTQEERFEEANILYNNKQYDEAIPLLSTLALENYAPALKLMGESFVSGIGVPQNTQMGYDLIMQSVDAAAKTPPKKETFEQLLKAAESGNANAQYALGEYYDSVFVWDKPGVNVAENWATAAEWYRKAAEQGHAQAQWQLGNAYDMGHGIERDHTAWRTITAIKTSNARGIYPEQRAR